MLLNSCTLFISFCAQRLSASAIRFTLCITVFGQLSPIETPVSCDVKVVLPSYALPQAICFCDVVHGQDFGFPGDLGSDFYQDAFAVGGLVCSVWRFVLVVCFSLILCYSLAGFVQDVWSEGKPPESRAGIALERSAVTQDGSWISWALWPSGHPGNLSDEFLHILFGLARSSLNSGSLFASLSRTTRDCFCNLFHNLSHSVWGDRWYRWLRHQSPSWLPASWGVDFCPSLVSVAFASVVHWSRLRFPGTL